MADVPGDGSNTGTGDTTTSTTDTGPSASNPTDTTVTPAPTSVTPSATPSVTPTASVQPASTGVPHSIIEFTDVVTSSWNTPLTEYSCLSRTQRDAIRNMIRDYMSLTNTNSNDATTSDTRTNDNIRAGLLSYPYLLGNSYYVALTSHNSGQLQTLANMIPSASSVDTVGKYILYLTMFLLTIGKENVTTVDKSVDYKSAVMNILLHKYLNRVFEIHSRKRCTYMFIGIPTYYWYGVGDLYTWAAPLLSKGTMKIYGAFLKYIKENPRDVPNPILTIKYTNEQWGFTKSVPEFVMEALGYRADDEIIKRGNGVTRIYIDTIYTSSATGAYSYYEIKDPDQGSSVTLSNGVPVTGISFDTDISAILIIPSGNSTTTGDGYAHLSKLITPSECGKQLTAEDADPPTRDNSKDLKLVDGQAEPASEIGGLLDEDPGSGDRRRGDLGTFANSIKLIKELEDRVNALVKEHLSVVNCCNSVSEGLSRLEKHAETLRRTMLLLVNKIDVQTGHLTARPAMGY